MAKQPPSVLIVDLNNFAHYPTIPIGMVTAALRAARVPVRLLSPLSVGVQGFARQTQAGPAEYLLDVVRFWSAMTRSDAVRSARSGLRKLLTPRSDGTRKRIVRAFRESLELEPPAVVMVSAYTQYYAVVAELGLVCAARGIPLIVGGPYFNFPAIAQRWLAIEGVSAVVAAEAEAFVAELACAAAAGEPLDRFPGVSVRAGEVRAHAPPLQQLDELPYPDYTDFPWHLYPRRIVPLMTARGCGWGACNFCSDVTTVMGRTYRSRTVDRVLGEIAFLAQRHEAHHFVFHDLKLNSDLAVWHAILNELPGLCGSPPVWTASVHVGNEPDNGLSLEELRAARAAGLSRITTGLESGSQSVLNAMGKGTRVERLADFCRNASRAGLSLRLTGIVGYPGETPDDLHLTAAFLEQQGEFIERVMLNRFSVMLGTPVADRIQQASDRYPLMRLGKAELDEALLPYHNGAARLPGYWRAMRRVLRAAHRINRRPLSERALAFEGVM